MIDFNFRRAEVIIFAIYIAIGIISIICLLLTSKPFDEAIAIMIMAPMCATAVVIEHKKQLIFNREINKFTIVEKALFRNVHKVNRQLQLDNITGAKVHSYISRSKNGSTMMYQLHINSNSEGTIIPFLESSSISNTATNFANKINEFLAGNEPSLIINHAPFIFRLFGIFFSVFYFLICYACITEIK